MLNSILSTLRSSASNDKGKDPATRRRHPRREVDRCVSVIYGQTFPVENWSFGGVRITADERMFGTRQDIEMVLKFKLRNTILDVNVRGRVLRKSQGKVVIEFEPLTQTIHRHFQQVVDDYVAGEFASSQA